MTSKTNKQELQEAKPYIRSLLAFILYLRFGTAWTSDQAYRKSDEFISQLERDM